EAVGIEHAHVDRRDRPRRPLLPLAHRLAAREAGGSPRGIVGGGWDGVHKRNLPPSSFPRKREPSRSNFRAEDAERAEVVAILPLRALRPLRDSNSYWVPAFAGMTTCGFGLRQGRGMRGEPMTKVRLIATEEAWSIPEVAAELKKVANSP